MKIDTPLNQSAQLMAQLVDNIVDYGSARVPAGRCQLFAEFVELYLSQASASDLSSRTTEDLYGLVLSHWQLMEQRLPGETKLRIFNPETDQHQWQSSHTVIQLVIDDMPFLVDSIRMVINRRGITIHQMIYMGGMCVVRNSDGLIEALSPYALRDDKAQIESPIYVEIDRESDPAALADLEANMLRVLNDVRLAVQDWQPMRQHMQETIDQLKQLKLPIPKEDVQESIAFLEWLLDDHFTFLGARDYKVVADSKELALNLVSGSGLGVLRDESHSKSMRWFSDLPEQARALMLSKTQLLIISKTNTHSTVHRATHTDYIGIKEFDEQGDLIGERRFIGLYTSAAYNSNPRNIPFLRKKVVSIVKRSGLPERSHAGKDLLHIMTTLPRDDLFQGTEDELYELAMGILHLQERRRIKLFVRHDAYGRFISALVYVPRENFNTDLVQQMLKILMKEFDGLEVSWTSDFSALVLARIHFVIRIDPKKPQEHDISAIEAQLREVGKSWKDGLREVMQDYFGEEHGNELYSRYCDAFPAGYRESFNPRNAVTDVMHIEKLSKESRIVMSFYRPPGAPRDVIGFKIFNLDHTIPLSDALPMLENMGLRVVGEQPHQLILSDNRRVWINDFNMTYSYEPTFEVEDVKPIFQEAFRNVWNGNAEDDEFNRLVLEAQLTWREISVLRAYTKYLRQTGFTYSSQYIAETMVSHANISRLLIDIFKIQFDPELEQQRQEKLEELFQHFEKAMDQVTVLDEDRILRRQLEVIRATLRTNFFHEILDGDIKPYLAFKLDAHKISDLPLPLPQFEVFVYSPRFEAVHLRAGKVARGGLRWSDRREDFRTEILGLMKAQRVKNALIVPTGAKGGFVPKCLPVGGTRDEILEEVVRCYQGFISGLLDITDNIVDGEIVPPINTVCYDEPDPYLVVAADKGTATFSDIANAIAKAKNFWLGDAFASGGSAGYDHKKMAITARGAWVSAECQFQTLNINLDESEITVIGIGDMAGDVFGNGLLMSNKIKLVAAFNHQHIFLDPNPDLAISYEERKRLFALPRSSWEDYNPDLISKGGGVYRRSVKAITLTPEVKALLDLDQAVIVPNELIKAIMRAKVDLLWNGGIGTFVKATAESNDAAGDRSNDAIRINASELQVKVVSEGGNLGFTQLGRIEFDLNGGHINTDFIDNSAGVDCSDHEVNIKIFLNDLIVKDQFKKDHRDAFLFSMTDEIAQLVLQNNYQQNRAISYASYLSAENMGLYSRTIDHMEASGKLSRSLEFIPDNKTLMERRSNNMGLTRPELAVLLSYSKIMLKDDIYQSEIKNDPYIADFIKTAFPTTITKSYATHLQEHPLRNEIISTQLSNRVITDMGIAFVYQMQDETGAQVDAIIRSYAVAREVFHLDEYVAEIESMDFKVDPAIQHKMLERVIRLIRRSTRWLLRNRRDHFDIYDAIAHFSEPVARLVSQMPELLRGVDKENLLRKKDEYVKQNVPEEIALKVATTSPMYHCLNIVEAATTQLADVLEVAQIYFNLVEKLDLIWFRDRINLYSVESRWSVLARSACKADLDWVQQALTIGVLRIESSDQTVDSRVNQWIKQNKSLLKRWKNTVADIRSSELVDFAILSVAIRELMDLAKVSASL